MEDIKKRRLSTKAKILIVLFIILFIGISLLWARFISTYGLVVKEVRVDNTTLSSEYDGLKVLQFTDLHYGSTVRKKEAEKIVDIINKQNADIIIFTGDLVDRNVELSDEEINELTELLNKIDANVEKYTVKGNHDFDHPYYDDIFEKTDFIKLNNSYDYFYKNSNMPIVIAGLDDYWKGNPDYKSAFSFLNDFNEQPFTILLLHEPDQVDEIGDYKFDIAFAGHSHLGQVRFPLVGALYTPYGAKKYTDSHYIVNGSNLYISGGIGTSTLKLRFFNKPSITLYRFYSK